MICSMPDSPALLFAILILNHQIHADPLQLPSQMPPLLSDYILYPISHSLPILHG